MIKNSIVSSKTRRGALLSRAPLLVLRDECAHNRGDSIGMFEVNVMSSLDLDDIHRRNGLDPLPGDIIRGRPPLGGAHEHRGRRDRAQKRAQLILCQAQKGEGLEHRIVAKTHAPPRTPRCCVAL